MAEEEHIEYHRLGLTGTYREWFDEADDEEQRQVFVDAWRRTIEDWRHGRPEVWEKIQTDESATLRGWENEGNGYDGVYVHTSALEKTNRGTAKEFVEDLRHHVEDAIENRYTK